MAIDREHLGAQPAKPAPWNDPRVRSIVYQILTLVAVGLLVAYFAHNTIVNLQRQGIASGFGFLHKSAGFAIPQTLIDYTVMSPNARVFWVGLLNTILVSVIGITLATLLGFVIGLARLSTNWLVARLATVYIETIRNVPLLLQILFWYFAVLQSLPAPRDSISIGGLFFLNNRGFYSPKPIFGAGFGWVWWPWHRGGDRDRGGALGAAAAGGDRAAVPDRRGQPRPADRPAAPVSARDRRADDIRLRSWVASAPGGLVLLPELVALLLALSIYTAAFIAEIVRAGILSVSHGQTEAAPRSA